MSFPKKSKWSEKENIRQFSERAEIANVFNFEKRILHNIDKNSSDENIIDILNTPIGNMPKKERDSYYTLFVDESGYDKISPENQVYFPNEYPKKVYDKTVLFKRLIDIIRENLLPYGNLDSEDLDIVPYYSIINNTEIVSGFLTFFRGAPHYIKDIGLFSFDINNKNFGKQVWEDFEECIIDYLRQDYTISWLTYKSNNVCKHYDTLIAQFNGYKESTGDSWRYWLNFKKDNLKNET